ncbi:MAG: LysR substrate-binding domain-containing protein, partial [Pseudomonadota bacterium]
LQVFERDNKKVFITPVGEKILQKIHQIEIDIGDLYQYSKAQKALLSYPLSLGIIPTIGPFLLPKVLPEVRKQYPNSQLILEEAQSQVLVNKVRNGELDTAIIALPYNTEGLHCFEFWQEDFYIIAHKTNNMILGKETSSHELDKSQLLLLEEGHCLKDHALSVCKFIRSEMGSSFSGTSLYTLIQMVSAKMGITFVPEMSLRQLLHDNKELKISHLNEPTPHRKIAFITRLNFSGVNNIELLIKIFRQQLKATLR